MAVSPEEQAFINDLPKAKITKRLPDCPAERLAQCRGESVPPASDNNFAAGQWREGSPPHPWDSEWFLAQLHDGSYAVLRPLPEEFTYDFSTADATYLMRHKVKRWAQLSDSNYVEPECKAVPPAGDVEVRDAFCAAYRGLKGYAPLRVEGTDQYTFFAAGFEVQSTRLTAERDDWKARCARRVEDIQLQAERHEQTQFELTKARELLNELVTCSPSEVWAVMDKARAYLAHQSARAKPEGGEE